MTVATRRMQDLTVDDHTLTVPLVWGDPDDGRTLDIHAAVVTREGGEKLPYLVYLQGGPGFEAPAVFHAPTAPSWLDTALEHYRVVMLDQRGTGRSTPIGDADLERGDAALAEHLTHFRADAIARDAEAVRQELGAETWTSLGQSFGGFATLTYLSTAPAALERVYITGGLSAVGRHPDEMYALTYDKLRTESERYYRRFPSHRDAVRRLVDLADAGRLVLPDGEVVSVSRVRSLGQNLGVNDGWQTLWELLELDPASNAFRYDLAAALPFDARNPIYYVLHESCCADGGATRWAADRVEPADFVEDPSLLTAEHVRRDWSATVPSLQPWRGVADLLAEHEWPRLYDEAVLAASEARGAAAVYVNDVFVPFEFSMQTSALLPGVVPWVTSEHEHNGLRAGADTLARLIDLAAGRRVR